MKFEIEIRKRICEIGQHLYDKGFVVANDGNISARLDDSRIIITPTGVSKGGMSPQSLIVIDYEGNALEGDCQPSSEAKMHLAIYRARPDVGAVVHAHPPVSTAFAVARKPMIKPIIAETIVTVGEVPVAPYALTGTNQVVAAIEPFLKDYNALLLANHGLVTWGKDLQQAFFRHESVEHYGKIMLFSQQIGGAVELNQSQIDDLVKLRQKLDGTKV